MSLDVEYIIVHLCNYTDTYIPCSQALRGMSRILQPCNSNIPWLFYFIENGGEKIQDTPYIRVTIIYNWGCPVISFYLKTPPMLEDTPYCKKVI